MSLNSKPIAAEVIDHLDSIDKKEAFVAEEQAVYHYEPCTDEERTLDRKINLKLDFCVTAILSWSFILCASM